jgi:phenylacetic acid degradation operon negative regulatory protein
MLLTILGEYLLPLEDGVWQETLVASLCAMGYSVQTSRQALARSARQGWLISERHGRRTRVHPSEETSVLLKAGADRIYGFGAGYDWDEEWLLVTVRVPEAQREIRNHLRTRLAWAGFGSLGGGLWITPHTDRESEVLEIVAADDVADVLSFKGSLSRLGDPQQVVDEAWNLDEVRAAYHAFIAEFTGAGATSPQEVFERQTSLVHAWRKFPFLDPNLPRELLDAAWPGDAAIALFRELHERWREPARGYFETLESGVIAGVKA